MDPSLKCSKIRTGITMAQDRKCRHHRRGYLQFRNRGRERGFRDNFMVLGGWGELKDEEMSLEAFHVRCHTLNKNRG